MKIVHKHGGSWLGAAFAAAIAGATMLASASPALGGSIFDEDDRPGLSRS